MTVKRHCLAVVSKCVVSMRVEMIFGCEILDFSNFLYTTSLLLSVINCPLSTMVQQSVG